MPRLDAVNTTGQRWRALWLQFQQRGGWWVVAQAVLQLAVLGLAVAWPGQTKAGPIRLAGAALMVLGGLIGLAGVKALGSYRTPFPRPAQHAPLVQHGIYALIRHPLYTSVLLVSAGWALLWQSLAALLAMPVLVVFYHAKARQEERWLLQKYPEYAEYQRRVRRFIPWIY